LQAVPFARITVADGGSVSLEEVALGETIANDFVLTNSGTAPLLLGSIALQGDGADAFDTPQRISCPDKVMPNGTCTVRLTFQPSKPISAEVKLRIDSNAQGSPTFITVKGSVCYPGCLAH
jgi:hypothetical protein